MRGNPVTDFECGEIVTIEHFTREEAEAIFGRPLVDAYYAIKWSEERKNIGRVTKIDRQKREVTIEFRDEENL